MVNLEIYFSERKKKILVHLVQNREDSYSTSEVILLIINSIPSMFKTFTRRDKYRGKGKRGIV